MYTQELLEPPPVLAATSVQLSLSFPDFSAHRVNTQHHSQASQNTTQSLESHTLHIVPCGKFHRIGGLRLFLMLSMMPLKS